MTTETPSARMRARILREMRDRKLSQTDIAGFLEWTQPRVSKVLHGRVALVVEDLAALCFAVGLSLTEAVRDHGLEFCADMTPTELRFLERIRQLDQTSRDAIMQILDVKTKTRTQERRALPTKAVRKKSG